jgi:hypothetical protein
LCFLGYSNVFSVGNTNNNCIKIRKKWVIINYEKVFIKKQYYFFSKSIQINTHSRINRKNREETEINVNNDTLLQKYDSNKFKNNYKKIKLAK